MAEVSQEVAVIISLLDLARKGTVSIHRSLSVHKKLNNAATILYNQVCN